MISIYYTNESVEGEPGPNFYWRGTPDNFLQLVNDLHQLGTHDGIELSFDNLKYVQTHENIKVILRSSKAGNELCNKRDLVVTMNLNKNTWRRVLDKILSVSYEKSHNYVEFDDLNLVESANVIISSDA
jgi:hypothetical protein